VSEPRSDRGVSEVLGFVISFSIIILSVGLVYTFGFGALTELRESEQLHSAERAISGTAATFETLQRGDPARASELRFNGGLLSVTNNTTMTVTVTGPGTTYTFTPGSLVYEYDGSRISYESGAVLRSDDQSGVMLRRPMMQCSGSRALVSVLTIDSPRNSVSGDSSVVVLARVQSNEVTFPESAATTPGAATGVELAIDSPNDAGWEKYFTRHPQWKQSGDEYVCAADRVFVRHTVVSLRFLT
jgi:hypothetical protein